MATPKKAYYKHHEKATDADVIASVKTREVAFSTEGNKLIGKTNAGLFLHWVRNWFKDTISYPSIAGAVADIGSTSTELQVTTVVTLTGNLTIPATCALRIARSGGINRAGFTLTINGPFKADSHQVFFGTGTTVLGPQSCKFTDPMWWGAVPDDSSADNTAAFQACFDATANPTTTADHPGICKIPAGEFWFTGSLNIPLRRFELWGAGPESTILYHNPATFSNFFNVDTMGGGFINLHGFSMRGATFQASKTRYMIEAGNLNEGSKIHNILMRNTVGFVKVALGYLADFDIRVSYSTTRPSSAGISQSEWEEVWGDGCAPFMFTGCNVSNIKVRTFRVASEEYGGVTPYAVMIVKNSAGVNIDNTNIEWGLDDYDTYTEGGVTYTPRVQHGLLLDGVTGNVNAIDVEAIRTTAGGIITCWTTAGALALNGVLDYRNYCENYRFLNRGGFQPIIKNWRGYDALGGVLFRHFDSVFSTHEDVLIEGGSMIAGYRVSQTIANGGASDDDENYADTYFGAGSLRGGIPDQDPLPTSDHFKVIPKILIGYAVTQGADPVYTGISPTATLGHYVEISGGVMMRTDGGIVSTKKPTADGQSTGLQQAFRLRPWTASKYYRLFIGRLGQPYLVEYNSAQTDPTGNWIVEFATDGSLAITGLASNLRLTWSGRYFGNGSYVVVYGTAAPVTGTWNKGDIFVNSNPSALSPFGWRCVTTGTSGTWETLDTAYALLAGRSGGQTLNGGTGAGEHLTLSSTANATKGQVRVGGATGLVLDELNKRLGIGKQPTDTIDVLASVDGGDVNASLTNSFTGAGSIDEGVAWRAIFGSSLAGHIRIVKEEDFTTGANRTAQLVIMLRKDGTDTDMLRISAANNRIGVENADLNVAGATALTAGGGARGIQFGSAQSMGIYFGSGAPSISAGKGSIYLRSDGSGTNDRAYVNTDGGTTWTALVTVA